MRASYLRTAQDCFFISIQLMQTAGTSLEIPVFWDKTRAFFMFTVTIITTAVYWFSLDYISSEKFFTRFHMLVLSFVISIFLLILSPSLISVLLGWDGLGVTSYLLVIYFNSNKSFNAGMITAVTNRLGDCFILIAIAMALPYGQWNLFLLSPQAVNPVRARLALLLIAAAITKRAQIPFSAWLPAAMAAPTPVSSLVHSSTLVTAGVYLLIRFDFFLTKSGASSLILIAGAITMILAGASALYETDMKKIVALSTLSQLGLIMGAIGLGLPSIAFFHLLTHAFFKALLFITVGNMIHLRADYQDLRKISLRESAIGITRSFRLVANFRLMGFPFIAGFYSKDLIIEMALLESQSPFVIVTFFVATLLTATYTLRFLFLVIWKPAVIVSPLWIWDNSSPLTLANSYLWPLAISGGSGLSWVLITSPRPIFLPFRLKLITPIVIIGGILLGTRWATKTPSANSGIVWSWGSIWSLPFRTPRITTPTIFSLSGLRRGYADLRWNTSFSRSPLTSLIHAGTNVFRGSGLTGFELMRVAMAATVLIVIY